MNTDMASGVLRHIITVIAGAVIANGTDSLNSVVSSLMHNLAAGDTNAIIGSSIALFAIIWSMWTKASEETKQNVVKKLSFKRG